MKSGKKTAAERILYGAFDQHHGEDRQAGDADLDCFSRRSRT